MLNLRYFKDQNKNCYTLPSFEDTKYLIRVGFYYGNYDRLSKPPVFDLQVDGNTWVTVVSLIDEPVYYEVIYIARGDVISICLARMRANEFPFISSLEAVPLSDGMYQSLSSDYAYLTSYRYHFGEDGSIGYHVDDPYNRVLRELAGNLDSMVDAMNITLSPVEGSDSSSMINAIEIYTASDMLNVIGTYEVDVEGLANITKGFEKLKGWPGEPCLPANTIWEWLNCSGGDFVRLKYRYLSGYGLEGTLPDFSQMQALQVIRDLHDNHLTGTIPDFLGKLPNPRTLNNNDDDDMEVAPREVPQLVYAQPVPRV
ncbi:Receptor-like protein kinase [Acorus calamus]|uniref:Receptor-like protein kinase n=1 Tax=Acorus calamus TaxID=4465 RepID=A0AAV9F375_ACOCL|nr:Receptor-like protein kinase [Acorus calamus]